MFALRYWVVGGVEQAGVERQGVGWPRVGGAGQPRRGSGEVLTRQRDRPLHLHLRVAMITEVVGEWIGQVRYRAAHVEQAAWLGVRGPGFKVDQIGEVDHDVVGRRKRGPHVAIGSIEGSIPAELGHSTDPSLTSAGHT